jgi:hypothetical protein
MTDKVITALLAKRAEIQGHILDLETKARRWRARLAHVDGAIRIFSPDTDPEAMQPKRGYRRGQYFRRGEFARLCMDALRKADAPILTADVVTGVIASKGLPDDPALVQDLTEKALGCLREKLKTGSVTKLGMTQGARWALVNSGPILDSGPR